MAERGVSLASRLKFAHKLWLLCCHSFQCIVLTRTPLWVIYTLVKCIVMKTGLLLPICIFRPHFCHALLLSQYLGARASSVSATHVSIIHHIHHSVQESTDSRAGGLWGQIGYQPAHIWRKTLSCINANYVGRHSLSTIMLLFPRSSFFISLLDSLLMWNLFYSLGYMQNTILTFYSGKWSLFLIAYTWKLVILRYSI